MTRALFCVTLALAACSSRADVPDAGVDATPTFADCEASDQSFVRAATLAVLGRRPFSQGEVAVYADLMAAVRARAAEAADAGPPSTLPDPREVVVRTLAREPEFVDRWAEVLMDGLKVPRIEVQSQQSCYGVPLRPDDDGELAAFVRDNLGASTGDGGGAFNMRDLLRSSIALDDISPPYRAHLFALVSRPIPAANVPREAAELARREDFGLRFDATLLNRDIVCLPCHNSESAVTEFPDPEDNRHWPLPGAFERAIYGDAAGTLPERAHAPFRFDGFADQTGGEAPWGWDVACGQFQRTGLPADPAGVDGLFGSLTGQTLSAYDLDRVLAAGFDELAQNGLTIAGDETIADKDAAVAYLVAANAVELVWNEVVGSRLTIANYFSRNKESRDLHAALTNNFVANRFSLESLLVDILLTPYVNRLAPSAGCGTGPYNMPPVFDPWVISDDDPARRQNGPGDAVAPLSARTLMRSAYQALEWRRPFFFEFPEEPFEIQTCQAFFTCAEMQTECAQTGTCCLASEFLCLNPPGPNEPSGAESQSFQKGIGAFLKTGEQGFRGLDFQARLVFEDRFGRCVNPGDTEDFIDQLIDAAQAGDIVVGEVVAALKDRLIGQARVEHEGSASGSERDAIEALFGAALTAPSSSVADLEGATRALCGALISSPQFLLSGIALPDGAYRPILTPIPHRYDAVCRRIAPNAPVSARCTPSGILLN